MSKNKNTRQRSIPVSHQSNPHTTHASRDDSLFPQFDAIKEKGNILLSDVPFSLVLNDKYRKKVRNAYLKILDDVESIADNTSITEDQIFEFTKRTLEFLELVQDLPPDIATNIQEKAQLNTVKNYVKECSETFLCKNFERLRIKPTPETSTLRELNSGLVLQESRLDERISKHRRKANKFEAGMIIAIIGISLLVTAPIAIPLCLFFEKKNIQSTYQKLVQRK